MVQQQTHRQYATGTNTNKTPNNYYIDYKYHEFNTYTHEPDNNLDFAQMTSSIFTNTSLLM